MAGGDNTEQGGLYFLFPTFILPIGRRLSPICVIALLV